MRRLYPGPKRRLLWSFVASIPGGLGAGLLTQAGGVREGAITGGPDWPWLVLFVSGLACWALESLILIYIYRYTQRLRRH